MVNTGTTPAKSAPAPVSKSPAAAPAPTSAPSVPASVQAVPGRWAPGASVRTRDREAGLKAATEAYEKASGQARGADGKFVPTEGNSTPTKADTTGENDASVIEAATKAAQEESAKVEASKEKPAPKAEESKFSEGDREKAATALKRAKIPQSAHDAMSEEERVQWGLSLAKSQAENDRKVQELSSKTKQGTETGAQADSKKPSEQPAQPGNLRGLADALMLDEAGERLLAGWQAEMEGKHAAEIDRITKLTESALTRMARESLVKEIPQLADDEAFREIDAEIEFEQVKPKYAEITDPYELVQACIRNLAKGKFADAIAAKAKEAARKESARRDAGQPSTTTKTGQVSKLNKREYGLASYRLLSEGKSPDEVRSLLGG